MPFGLIAGLILLGGLAAWGIALRRAKVRESATEASSHYERRIGQYGDGHSTS
jgi:hypothetical protein